MLTWRQCLQHRGRHYCQINDRIYTNVLLVEDELPPLLWDSSEAQQ